MLEKKLEQLTELTNEETENHKLWEKYLRDFYFLFPKLESLQSQQNRNQPTK